MRLRYHLKYCSVFTCFLVNNDGSLFLQITLIKQSGACKTVMDSELPSHIGLD